MRKEVEMWKNFFDELGVDYSINTDNEKEKDMYYLSDFFIPLINICLEILSENATSDERKLAKERGKKNYELSGIPAVICDGEPLNHMGLLLCDEYNDSSAGYVEMDCVFYEKDEELCLLCLNSKDRTFYSAYDRDLDLDNIYTLCGLVKNKVVKRNDVIDSKTGNIYFSAKFRHAYRKALEAEKRG